GAFMPDSIGPERDRRTDYRRQGLSDPLLWRALQTAGVAAYRAGNDPHGRHNTAGEYRREKNTHRAPEAEDGFARPRHHEPGRFAGGNRSGLSVEAACDDGISWLRFYLSGGFED